MNFSIESPKTTQWKWLFLFLSLFPSILQAQDEKQDTTYRHLLQLRIDNDAFTGMDGYYTAGLNLAYRRLMGENAGLRKIFKAENAKLMMAYQYGFKMFTPLDISEEAFLDGRQIRPYAGLQYLKTNIVYFPKAHSGCSYGLEIGMVGEQAGMESLQQSFHRIINTLQPFGWENQISNEWIVNLHLQAWREISLGEAASIVSHGQIVAGTGQTFLSSNWMIRAGTFSDVQHTAFGGSRLGRSSAMSAKEDYVFFALRLDYVLHNIFIEGSLFDSNPSPQTAIAKKWLFGQEFGFHYSYPKWAFRLSFHHLGVEIEDGKGHFSMTLQASKRF